MENQFQKLNQSIKKHFFDFLMLFIAVYLGFLVDNYRDKWNEANIVQELSEDLKIDINADIKSIETIIQLCKNRNIHLDSLIHLSHSPVTIEKDSLFYQYLAKVNDNIWFYNHANTFNLAVSAGYLRYFDQKISQSLTSYYNSNKECINLLISNRSKMDIKIFPFFQQLFKTSNFNSIVKTGKLKEKPIIRNWNEETKWLFQNYISELKHNNNLIINKMEVLVLEGREVVNDFK